MAKLPAVATAFKSNLISVASIPVFWLCFVLLYQPDMWEELLVMDNASLNFNATIIMCIVLGVVLISRGLLVAVHRSLKLNWTKLYLWQFLETLAISMFTALYITLMFRGEYTYFYMVGKCLYGYLLTLIYPIVIANLSCAFIGRSEADKAYDDSLMRFVDSTKKLKLMIASSAVLYIEADENYVHVRYLEGERVKDYPLRSSMKSLEELMQKHGLIRCQRSYYINPQHIKVLRRDKEGMISAELSVPNQKSIPVSPRYYDDVAKWL